MIKQSSPKSQTPILAYWDTFVKKYSRRGRSQLTIRNTKDALNFVVRHLGIKTIEECNNHIILEDRLHEAKEKYGWKGSTFNSYLKNLKTYFIWLEQQEYIEENKLKKIPRCADELNEQPILSEEQIKIIIAQLHTRRQKTLERLRNVFFIDMLRLTGARPSELLSMKMEDIRPHKNSFQAVIRGKKQKGRIRYYNMPSWVRDSYITYMQFRATLKNRESDDSLFISQSKKTGWTQKGMRNLFRRLSKELGFRVTAYGFRRFTATHLNEKGVGLDKIQDYLGHTRASTTKRYIARTGKLTQDGVDVISEIFRLS